MSILFSTDSPGATLGRHDLLDRLPGLLGGIDEDPDPAAPRGSPAAGRSLRRALPIRNAPLRT